MEAERAVEVVNAKAHHEAEQDDQRLRGAEGQQEDRHREHDDVQVGEVLPPYGNVLEDEALQQQQPHEPQCVGQYGAIHLLKSRIPPNAPALP
jgi:hypothetical protein